MSTTPPDTDYVSAWAELRGYVQQARDDGTVIVPGDLLDYMDELRHRTLAPFVTWMRAVRDRGQDGP